MNRRHFFGLAVSFALSASGCGAGTGVNGPPTGNEPTVEASFLSASLSDDCQSSAEAARRGAPAADCASSEDAGSNGLWAGCGICRQTAMQLRFVVGTGDTPVRVDVVSVRLRDAQTNDLLDTLTAREPSRWDDVSGTYRAWDQNLVPGSNLRASWKLSAPGWDRVYGAGGRTFRTPLRLEVVLRIDGVERTLRSGELSREAEVAT